jgi:uncharacterized protein YndB with AHSA1/START domain
MIEAMAGIAECTGCVCMLMKPGNEAFMKEQEPDWTSFRKRIAIDKSIQDVYTAWAEPTKLENWFLEKAVYVDDAGKPRKSDALIQQGDRFIWKWHNRAMEENGEVMEANGTDLLGFTFGAGGKVRIEISEKDDATDVLLTHYDLPADEENVRKIYVDCITGWTFWLTNLKAWLEHGITLHARGLAPEETENLVNS